MDRLRASDNIEKRVMLLSCYRYPAGDAGAVRQQGFAKLFMALGYSVTIVALGECSDFTTKEDAETGATCCSLRYPGEGIYSKIKSRVMFFDNALKLVNDKKPTHILVEDIGLRNLFRLKKHCNKNGITLIHDSVEWYSSSEFKLGVLSPEYISKCILNSILIDKNIRVIAISRYLEKYYAKKGIATVRIPVFMDYSLYENKKKRLDSEIVTILYAGSPGRKDYLKEVINALNILTFEERKRIKLRIIGCTKEQLIKNCGVSTETINSLSDSLEVKGRLSREEVLKQYESADFSVLIRPQLRYAQAGFPTKAVESLMTGTPIICNLTSDLELYLTANKDSVILKDSSTQELINALRYICGLSIDQRLLMSKSASATAAEKFGVDMFSSVIKRIL